MPGVIAGTGFVFSIAVFHVGATTGVPVPRELTLSERAPLPGEGLRTTTVRRYRMAGRVRPLLFWFGKDDVGLARITWRSADDGRRAYELLVGTDPAKAPRGLNKWGFVAEQTDGATGHLLAMMTGDDTASYDDAAADAERPRGTGDFRAIAGAVAGGRSAWRTTRIATTRAFTVHDVDATLDRVRTDAAAAVPRERALTEDVRPGFLVALAELIERDVRGSLREGAASAPPEHSRVRYVFGQGLYELARRESKPISVQLGDRTVAAIRSTFEITTQATNARTRFDVSIGTNGELAGVPVAAEWQPRWWLKVALTLQESAVP
jgi:hypothetical protein